MWNSFSIDIKNFFKFKSKPIRYLIELDVYIPDKKSTFLDAQKETKFFLLTLNGLTELNVDSDEIILSKYIRLVKLNGNELTIPIFNSDMEFNIFPSFNKERLIELAMNKHLFEKMFEYCKRNYSE